MARLEARSFTWHSGNQRSQNAFDLKSDESRIKSIKSLRRGVKHCIFAANEENEIWEITKIIEKRTKITTPWIVRKIGYIYAKRTFKKCVTVWTKTKLAGVFWCQSFLKRHKMKLPLFDKMLRVRVSTVTIIQAIEAFETRNKKKIGFDVPKISTVETKGLLKEKLQMVTNIKNHLEMVIHSYNNKLKSDKITSPEKGIIEIRALEAQLKEQGRCLSKLFESDCLHPKDSQQLNYEDQCEPMDLSLENRPNVNDVSNEILKSTSEELFVTNRNATSDEISESSGQRDEVTSAEIVDIIENQALRFLESYGESFPDINIDSIIDYLHLPLQKDDGFVDHQNMNIHSSLPIQENESNNICNEIVNTAQEIVNLDSDEVEDDDVQFVSKFEVKSEGGRNNQFRELITLRINQLKKDLDDIQKVIIKSEN